MKRQIFEPGVHDLPPICTELYIAHLVDQEFLSAADGIRHEPEKGVYFRSVCRNALQFLVEYVPVSEAHLDTEIRKAWEFLDKGIVEYEFWHTN